jgi:nucleoside-diphosphate-sugar epimerase
MNISKTSPILVTGATGYIASHVVKVLLENGYKVRGSVRSLAKKEKYDFLYKFVPEGTNSLEFVEADLLVPESWKSAVEGVEYVMHVASPFPNGNPKDENELIKPAVEGTLNILEAAVEKGVKKVILTSSVAAVMFGNSGRLCGPEDWSIEEKCSPYCKSKLRAEKAAWDFWRKHEGKFELATVNPSLTFGPILSHTDGTSEQIVIELLSGKVPALPNLNFPIVDVRDVAECHLQALLSPNSDGKRFICSKETLSFLEIAEILRKDFGKYGYKIPKSVIGKFILTIVGIFNKKARDAIPEINLMYEVNNELSIKELGLKYRTSQETLVEMGYSLIKAGAISDKITQKTN